MFERARTQKRDLINQPLSKFKFQVAQWHFFPFVGFIKPFLVCQTLFFRSGTRHFWRQLDAFKVRFIHQNQVENFGKTPCTPRSNRAKPQRPARQNERDGTAPGAPLWRLFTRLYEVAF